MVVDVLIVGSGVSAVHAAWPLVDAGLSVAMLDVGIRDQGSPVTIPPLPFTEVRRLDAQQHRYFLGDDFSGIPLGPIDAGPQITYPRRHVIGRLPRAPQLDVRGLVALESLAAGGLAGAWGAVSFDYVDTELERSGLVPSEMRRHYEAVATRIGISVDSDDLAPLRGRLSATQPALAADANALSVLRKYTRRRDRFNRHGVHIGRPMLAVLSQQLNERSANPYHDMDFWTDEGDSVYRPELTLRALRQRPTFDYQPDWLVREFVENADGTVDVHAHAGTTGAARVFRARRVVIGAGSLGTTRIVLRSFRQYDVAVPFVCNPHTYVPSLNLSRLGQSSGGPRHSLAQLTMIYDPTRDGAHLVQGQMYSYGSLLLFRLLAQWPLDVRAGLRVMRDITPILVIWLIQHEDMPRPGSSCRLRRLGDQDRLEIEYAADAALERRRDEHERVMMRWMRRCGCWPIRAIRKTHGSSVHYGGQLPMTAEERPLTTHPSGRLRGTRSVFVADGSALAYLPAKGPTLTLMANANRVGHNVIESLRD